MKILRYMVPASSLRDELLSVISADTIAQLELLGHEDDVARVRKLLEEARRLRALLAAAEHEIKIVRARQTATYIFALAAIVAVVLYGASL